jgi:hypothetical protein
MNMFPKLLLLSLMFNVSCKSPSPAPTKYFNVEYIKLDGVKADDITLTNTSTKPLFEVAFSSKIDTITAKNAFTISDNTGKVPTSILFKNNDSTAVISPENPLKNTNKYNLEINQTLKSQKNEELQSGIQLNFSTKIDSTDKFPKITDEQLLDLVQKQTFKYFWDFGHPVSGLARERDTSGDVVTSGGSGFGIMAIPIAIKRDFISREEGLKRMLKITDFLLNKTVSYHGVFPHWINGATGATIAFSPKDDAADLVETSYLIMGLLTARQYFDLQSAEEIKLRSEITKLWEAVEWDWHTQGGQDVLYWHWSPKYNWEMNHKIGGYNEALITYILAAASPTHSVKKSVYDIGWAKNGQMKNGKSFYGITLPLGEDLGGPLFFEQYTFLGIDPRNLKDSYANYWEQVKNHTLINRAYCIENPKKYIGYSKDIWGLTASDNHSGYSAHSPTNDLGVITPTAALSAMPFAPEESMQALRFFYYKLGDKLWKNYGFVDSFNLDKNWYASSFLAIDQGPIIGMIENHRSGMLWNLTMKDPDLKRGLKNLGFSF